MQKLGLILAGIVLLALAGYVIKLLVLFAFWLWERSQKGLRSVSLLIAKTLGFFIRERPARGVVIPSTWRVVSFSLLVVIGLLGSQMFLKGWALFATALAIMTMALLVLLTKIVMLQEDSRVQNGLLLEDNAVFRHLQGAIPASILVMAAILFFTSFVFSIAAFDMLMPGTLFVAHAPIGNIDWFVTLAMQFSFFKSLASNLPLDEFTVIQTTQQGQLFLSLTLPVLFGILVYSAVLMQVRQLIAIRELLEGLRSDREEVNVEYLQRRIALAPSKIKRQLIHMFLHEDNPIVRRRIISVAPHVPIYSFPKKFLENLQQETEANLREWGLVVCQRMVEDDGIQFEPYLVEGMLRAARYQRHKNKDLYNSKEHSLLKSIESKLASR